MGHPVPVSNGLKWTSANLLCLSFVSTKLLNNRSFISIAIDQENTIHNHSTDSNLEFISSDAEEVLRHKVMFEELPLNGIPHVMLGLKKFTCQHGPKRKCDIKKSKMVSTFSSKTWNTIFNLTVKALLCHPVLYLGIDILLRFL